jgi:hypothetical protein
MAAGDSPRCPVVGGGASAFGDIGDFDDINDCPHPTAASATATAAAIVAVVGTTMAGY